MNSHAIKLTGKFEVAEPLEIDKSYGIKIMGGIVSISKQSQENGEYQFTYKIVPEFGEVEKDNGTVIKIQDKKKQSVKLRSQLAQIAQDRGLDQEEFYQATMVKFRHYTLEILDFLEGLKNI